MKLISVISLSLLSIVQVYGQSKEYCKVVPKLEIVNQQFDSIIKYTVSYLKSCKHYSENLSFKVEILKQNDTVYIGITNSRVKDVFLTEPVAPLVGFFVSSNHYFYVFRDLDINILRKLK